MPRPDAISSATETLTDEEILLLEEEEMYGHLEGQGLFNSMMGYDSNEGIATTIDEDARTFSGSIINLIGGALSSLYGVEDVFQGSSYKPGTERGREYELPHSLGIEDLEYIARDSGLGKPPSQDFVDAAKYITKDQGTGKGSYFDHNADERDFRNTMFGDFLEFEPIDIKGGPLKDMIIESAYSMIGTDVSRPGSKDLWPSGKRYGSVCADAACDAFQGASIPWPIGPNGDFSSDIDFSIEAFKGSKCKSGDCGGDLNPGLSEQFDKITDHTKVAPGDVAFISGRGHSVIVTQVYKDGVVEVVHEGGSQYPVYTKTYSGSQWANLWERYYSGGEGGSGIAFRFNGKSIK